MEKRAYLDASAMSTFESRTYEYEYDPVSKLVTKMTVPNTGGRWMTGTVPIGVQTFFVE